MFKKNNMYGCACMCMYCTYGCIYMYAGVRMYVKIAK